MKEVDILIEKAILVGVCLQKDEHFTYSMEEYIHFLVKMQPSFQI